MPAITSGMYVINTLPAEAALVRLQAKNSAVIAGMTTAWSAFGKTLIAGAAGFAAMGAATAGSYMAINEWNKSMTHARAIGQLTEKQMWSLGEASLKMGIKYGYSSDSIAAGLVELTKAGLDYEQMMLAMEPITQAAVANNLEWAQAAEISIMATKAFNKDFADLTETLDKAQYVVNATLMEFGDMQKMLAYAGSTSMLATIQYEQLLAVMGTLTDAALKAGIGARSVNQMFIELVDHTDKIQQWANAMGLSVDVVKDGVLNLDGLIEAFGTLDFTMDTLRKSHEIFNTRAMRSWAILITHSKEYQQLLDATVASQGYLSKTTEIQITSLQAQMRMIGEAFIKPFRQAGISGSLNDVISELTKNMDGLGANLANMVIPLMTQFKDIIPYLIDTLTGLIEIGGGVLLILKGFSDFLRMLGPDFLKFVMITMLLSKVLGIHLFKSIQLATVAMGNYIFTSIALMGVTTKLGRAELALARTTMLVAAAQMTMNFAMIAGGGAMMAAAMGYKELVPWLTVAAGSLAGLTVMLWLAAKGWIAFWTAQSAIVGGVVGIAAAGAVAYGSSLMSAQQDKQMNDMKKMKSQIGIYHGGTSFVPRTGMAWLKQGESVTPSESGRGGSGSVYIDLRGAMVADEDVLIEKISKSLDRKHMRDR